MYRLVKVKTSLLAKMTQCCVEGCPGVGTHRFPTNLKMRALWIKAIRRPDLLIKVHTRICRRHFLDSDFSTNQYYDGPNPRTRLRFSAVPTLFLDYGKQNTGKHFQTLAAPYNNAPGSQKQSGDFKSEELATKQTQFTCNACDASFATRCLLYYHKIYHPHYCTICKKSFKSVRSIAIHECTVCPTCEENFSCVSQLNDHKNQSKCKKKPKVYCKCCFYCPNCSEQFAVKKNLIQHLEELKYPCQICKKCYRLSEELSAHIVAVHEMKVEDGPRKFCKIVLLCCICKAKFNDSAALVAHMRSNIHQPTVLKAGPSKIAVKTQNLNAKIKRVPKIKVAVDTGRQTIGDVVVKKEPATTAPVWVELEVKNEPVEQPNMDVEVKQEPEWVDVKIEPGIDDVTVKEEIMKLETHIKEEPEES